MASVSTVVDVPRWAVGAVNRHLPSFEAYRAYLAANEAARARNMERAGELFMRAAELDTGFTDALRGLIWMRVAYGQWSMADSMLRILERRNRSEPRDVQLGDAVIRARLYGHEGRFSALEALYDELGIPKTAEFRVYEEGNALVGERRLREARDRYLSNPAAGSARTGIYSYWISLGHAYHQLGDYQAELDAARRGLKEFPGHLGLRGEEARSLAALGKPAEIGPVLDVVTTAPPGPGTWNAGSIFAITAREARTHGLSAVESDARRRLIAWASRLSTEERAREGVFFGLSSLLYGAGAWPELAAQADIKLARDSVTIAWHGYRAIAAAMVGDSVRARREDAWLAALGEADLRRGLSRGPPASERALMRGLIAGALGDKSRAIALLREAKSRGFLVDIEFHTDPIMARFADDAAVKDLQAIR
jgi:tetratricopeptide (TPR) repeat protein